MNTLLKVIFAGLIAIFLTACGGSSGGGDTTPPPTTELPPTDGTPPPSTELPPTEGIPPVDGNPTPPTDELGAITMYYDLDLNYVGVGIEGQFNATAHYNASSDKEYYQKDITNSTTWTSSNTAVATISSSGVFKALSAGRTEIKATYMGLSTNYYIDVIEAYVSSIIVTPSMETISVGDSVLLTVKGKKTDGTIVPINEGGWNTSNNAIASVDYFDGVVEGIAAGTATISTRWHDTSANFMAEGEAEIVVE